MMMNDPNNPLPGGSIHNPSPAYSVAPAAVLPSAERYEAQVAKALRGLQLVAANLQKRGLSARPQLNLAQDLIASIPALLATARAEGEAAGRAEQWRACREAVDRADLNWIAGHKCAEDVALDALDAIKPENDHDRPR